MLIHYVHNTDTHFVSWEPEGCYHYSKMFHWEPESRYHHRLCTAIAAFWFSTEHLWVLTAPILALNGRFTLKIITFFYLRNFASSCVFLPLNERFEIKIEASFCSGFFFMGLLSILCKEVAKRKQYNYIVSFFNAPANRVQIVFARLVF